MNSLLVLAAATALQIKVDLDINWQDARRQTLHMLVTVPVGTTEIIGGLYETVRGEDGDTRVETKVKLTPEMTDDGHPMITLSVLQADATLSSAKVITDLGQPVEVKTSGEDGPTVKIGLTAVKARMLPIGRHDLIDQVHHGLYFENDSSGPKP